MITFFFLNGSESTAFCPTHTLIKQVINHITGLIMLVSDYVEIIRQIIVPVIGIQKTMTDEIIRLTSKAKIPLAVGYTWGN